ncbi:MAG: hypothetical protein QXU18_11670 [Thermoplasmatales archaeon]
MYKVRTYRDKSSKSAKQDITYLGRELGQEGKKIVVPPKNRNSVRRVLDSAGYIMYKIIEDYEFIEHYDKSISP